MHIVNRYNSNNRPTLSIDQILRKAPSVFATAPHADASSKYEFIPTTDILNALIGTGWNCVEARELRVNKDSKRGFQKHELRFTRPDLLMPDGSSIDIAFTNSHDLTTASIMSAAFWRKVCSNGLHVSADLVEPIRVKHIGSKAENFIEASFRLIESVPQIIQSVESMQAINLDHGEKLAFANAAMIAKYGEVEFDKALNPETLLRPRRYDDQKTDLWTTFNVLQENLVKGGQRTVNAARTKRVTTRGITSITENTKLNQALWTLAESMKKLKTA